MADLSPSGATALLPPVTEEVFLDDRKRFWAFFTSLVFRVSVGLVVLLVLLAFFLL